MNIPVNFFTWGMAFLPIIVLIVLMVKCHWGAAEASAVGMLITVVTGLTGYKAGILLIAAEAAKGIWDALIILLIVWTAILMYHVGKEANAFAVIRSGMRRLLPNELLQVLAMGWIFESFLQGITGFGVPVAVGAPLLIGIGVTPIWSVIIPLISQAWGNTFGTLAAAWDSLVSFSGLSVGSALYFETAFWTAFFIWLWNIATGFIICWFYGRGRAIRKGAKAVAIMALIQGGGELLLSQVNTTLCCFFPALIALVVVMGLGRTKNYREPWRVEDSPIMNRLAKTSEKEALPEGMGLVQAFIPYIFLSAVTLVVLLIPPIHNAFGTFKIGLAFPRTMTGYRYVNAAVRAYSAFAPLTHASLFLFLSSMVGLAYYKQRGWIGSGGTRRIFVDSVSMTMPSGIAVVGLVIMSKIMGGTGQTIVLARGISGILSQAYLILAPFVGLLGTFMTGSNMSSNILFGSFQMTSAKLLQASPALVLAAQTTGASIGAAVSPSKIILGTTTAGILGKEGEVLKKILIVTVPAVILIGLMIFVLTLLGL
jgi:lactate permease